MKEINLLKFLKFLLTKIVIIVVCVVVGAVAGFGYSQFLVTPMYRSSTTILINNGGFTENTVGSSVVSGTNISASLSLVPTCVDVLKSDKIFEDMHLYLDKKYSASKLKSSFVASARGDDSLIIDIYAFSNNPEESVMLANTFLEIVPTLVPSIIPNVEIKVLSTAKNAVQTQPRTLFNTFVGAFIVTGLCIFAFFIIFLTKNTIDTEDDLKKNYNIPTLGSVPLFENKQSGGKRYGKTRK